MMRDSFHVNVEVALWDWGSEADKFMWPLSYSLSPGTRTLNQAAGNKALLEAIQTKDASRVNSARIRQPGPDYGLDSQAKVIETPEWLPLRSEAEGIPQRRSSCSLTLELEPGSSFMVQSILGGHDKPRP